MTEKYSDWYERTWPKGVGLNLSWQIILGSRQLSEPLPEHLKHVQKDTFLDDKNRTPVSSGMRSPIIYLRKALLRNMAGTVRWLRKQWDFSLIVLLPTAVVAVYLLCLASPQYISETHFLVRGKSINNSAMGGLSSLLETSHGGSQDTYAVQDYMMSRDALKMLIEKVHINKLFNDSSADFLAKFPSFFLRKDFESFYSYYRRHIDARIDEETGISHLKVRTFSALNSQRIAQTLLDAGEKLVNEINDRQRYNTLHAAQMELDTSLKELHDTEMQLAIYRYSNEIIDPMKQAIPMVGTALSLETKLSMLEAEKKQLILSAPNSPLIKVYAQRIASIQAQMSGMQAHITGQKGEGQGSLVPKLLGYDELTVKKSIIEKKILAETSALEMAKAQADRQMLYVTVVAQPSLPDYPEYPKNLAFLFITFLSALLVYATGKLLVAGAREHALQ